MLLSIQQNCRDTIFGGRLARKLEIYLSPGPGDLIQGVGIESSMAPTFSRPGFYGAFPALCSEHIVVISERALFYITDNDGISNIKLKIIWLHGKILSFENGKEPRETVALSSAAEDVR